MTDELVQLAILVPEDIADEAVIHAEVDGSSVEVSRPAASKQAGGDLGFDPVTGVALVWVGLKVVGGVAAKTAVGIVVKELWDRWRAKSKKPKSGELTIRFPNGEQHSWNLDDPIDPQQLQNVIEKHGKT